MHLALQTAALLSDLKDAERLLNSSKTGILSALQVVPNKTSL